MGIRFRCPNGHKLNVKTFQTGKRGICPYCGAKFTVPAESTLPPSGKPQADEQLGEGQTVAAGDTGRPSPQPVAEETAESRTPVEQPPVEQPPVEQPPAEAPTSEQQDVEQPADGQPTTEKPARKKKAPPVDLLSEDPDAQWYVRPPSGGQFGPAVGEVMRAWIKDGRITAESLVWREGWQDWVEAVTVFPRLALVRWLPDDGAKKPPPPPPKPRPEKTAASKEEKSSEAERAIGPLVETRPVSKSKAARRGGGRRRTRSAREIKQRRVNMVIGLSVLAVAMAGVLTWILMR